MKRSRNGIAVRSKAQPKQPGSACAYLGVTPFVLAQLVERLTAGHLRHDGIPLARIIQSESQKLLHIEEELHKKVIGQEEAIPSLPPQYGARAPDSLRRAARWDLSFSSAPPAWEKLLLQKRLRIPFW